MNEPSYKLSEKLKMTQMLLLFFFAKHLQGCEKIDYKEVKKFFRYYVYEIRNVNKVIDYLKKKNLIDIKKPRYHTKLIIPLEFGLNRAKYYLDHPDKYDTEKFMKDVISYLETKLAIDAIEEIEYIQRTALEKLDLKKQIMDLKRKNKIDYDLDRIEERMYEIQMKGSYIGNQIGQLLHEYYQSKETLCIWLGDSQFVSNQYFLAQTGKLIKGYVVKVDETDKQIDIENIQNEVSDSKSNGVICIIDNSDDKYPVLLGYIDIKPIITPSILKSRIDVYIQKINSQLKTINDLNKSIESQKKEIDELKRRLFNETNTLERNLKRVKGRTLSKELQRNSRSGSAEG